MFTPSESVNGDYGGFYRSNGGYLRFRPADIRALRAGLVEAAARRLAVRVRGAAHSMNGSAVPRAGELLIETAALDAYRFETPATVTVEAGAAIWDVQRMLAAWNAQLRVYNDGAAAASTVGGFVAAGGFGATSWRHGGFWETVERIDIVTVNGEARSVTRDDPLFRWLFGSMGQLAITVAATLVIEPNGVAPLQVPVGADGRVPASHHDWERIVWFSAFVPRAGWSRARRELAAIGARHAGSWSARPPYAYSLPFGRFNPPLIHPSSDDLVAVGIWGEAPPGGFDLALLRALDEEFTGWLRANPAFRRYAQTELLYPGFDFEAHFGAACYAEFRAWKRRLDPDGRLAPGLFDQPATA